MLRRFNPIFWVAGIVGAEISAVLLLIFLSILLGACAQQRKEPSFDFEGTVPFDGQLIYRG